MEGAAAVVDLDVRMWCFSFNIGASECGDWCVVRTPGGARMQMG